MTVDSADIFGSDQVGIHLAAVGNYVFHPPELTEPIKEKIDNVMFTCVALHNMLLDWDFGTGRLLSWEVEPGWGEFEGEADGDEDEERLWCAPKLMRQKRGTFVAQPGDDFSDCGVLSVPIGAEFELGGGGGEPEEGGYWELHAKPVKHHAELRAAHAVGWLRS